MLDEEDRSNIRPASSWEQGPYRSVDAKSVQSRDRKIHIAGERMDLFGISAVAILLNQSPLELLGQTGWFAPSVIAIVIPIVAFAVIALGLSVWSYRHALSETRERLKVLVEREQAESELQKTQAILNAAIEASPAGILIAEAPDGRIRTVNSAALGIREAPSEFLSDIPAELHPQRWHCLKADGSPYQPEELPLSRAIFEGVVSHNVDVIIQRSSGEKRWVLGNAAPVKNESGDIVGGVVVFPDVTELKETEAELRRLNAELEGRVQERTSELRDTVAELESFAYSVSHDLRAPLRAMEGFATALLEDCGERLDAEGLESVQLIIESAVRMDALISDLLEYSRLSRTELPLSSVSWNRVIEEAVDQLKADIESVGAVIEVEEALGSVIGHYSTMVQIATNLISNAIKFTPDGTHPHVHILSEPVGGTADSASPEAFRLSVKDNGIGIDAEYQDRIFRVFERLHGIESYPGTGIGLAIVAKACERLEGKVGFESSVGDGSQFWVEFTSAEALMHRPAEKDSPSTLGESSQSP